MEFALEILPRQKDDKTIKLSNREIEVLTLVVEGISNQEIADRLLIGTRTVNFHRANIYDKLQVSNRVQAFRKAARLGLIPFDPQFAADE